MGISAVGANRRVNYRQMQLTFAGLMGIFTLFLFVIVVYRSAGRSSFVGGSAALSESGSQLEGIQSPVQSSSNLHLRDFHRSEVKNGRLAWEIQARDARYFAEDSLAQLSDAAITVHRPDGSSVTVRSRAGKIFVEGMTMQRAELEGNIEVLLDNSITVETEIANFDAAEERITAPGSVTISGPGFLVTGVGLRVLLTDQKLSLARDVSSRFERGGRVPEIVDAIKPAN